MPSEGTSLLESMRRQSELFLAAYAACTAATHLNESVLIAKRRRGDVDDDEGDDDEEPPMKKTRSQVVRLDPWDSEIGLRIRQCRDAPSAYHLKKWRKSFRVPWATFLMLVQVRCDLAIL